MSHLPVLVFVLPPQLAEVLKDVKYIQTLNIDIPVAAMTVFEKRDLFTKVRRTHPTSRTSYCFVSVEKILIIYYVV